MRVLKIGLLQIVHVHGDETVLLLLNIDKLQNTPLPQRLESKRPLQIPLFQPDPILAAQYEQRPHAPARICIKLDFPVLHVPDNGHLIGNPTLLPEHLEPLLYVDGFVGDSNPPSIQHNLMIRDDLLCVDIHIELLVFGFADVSLEVAVLLL